jgi:hypothetical protein
MNMLSSASVQKKRRNGGGAEVVHFRSPRVLQHGHAWLRCSLCVRRCVCDYIEAFTRNMRMLFPFRGVGNLECLLCEGGSQFYDSAVVFQGFVRQGFHSMGILSTKLDQKHVPCPA